MNDPWQKHANGKSFVNVTDATKDFRLQPTSAGNYLALSILDIKSAN